MRRLVGVPRLSNPFALLPREVAVLAAVALAVAVGYGIVAPAIPVFAREFGVGKTAAGAVISAFAFMRFVSALAGGQLVERFGERLILSSGILVVAVSTGLSGLAQSYEQLLVLRGLGGVGSAMFTVSAFALLFRVVGGSSRGRASGLFQGGFLIGGLVGPAIGGVLAEVSLRLPFFVYAGTLLVAGAIAAVFLARSEVAGVRPTTAAADRPDPSEREAAPHEAAPREEATEELDHRPAAPEQPAHRADDSGPGVRSALRHPAYLAALVSNFGTGWGLFGVRISLIPLFVTEALEVTVVWVGVGFLCSSLTHAALLLPAGRYVDQVGRRPAMLRGGLVAAVAMLLLAFSTALPLFVVSMLLFGVGSAYLGTGPPAVVGDVMGGRGGRVVAVFQMASDAGAILGPLVAGALADTLSYTWAWSTTAGVLLIGVLMAARMPETRVPDSAARAPDAM